MRGSEWLTTEVAYLQSAYGSRAVSKQQIIERLSRHTWGAIRRRAGILRVQRPHPVNDSAHPLVQQFVDIVNAAQISPIAVCEEAGMSDEAASRWLRGRGRSPDIMRFDRVLREVGMHLTIAPLEMSENGT